MKAFISHNKADRDTARLLAVALVEQGGGVWLDEWDIRLGDSIAGGIEEGLAAADVFVLLWSSHSQKSNWVGTELRAYLNRRVSDSTLRVVPIMLDDTPLPVLVADFKGARVTADAQLAPVAASILGYPLDRDIARVLQNRLMALAGDNYQGNDPFPYLVCPECGSSDLKRSEGYSVHGHYVDIACASCGWGEGGEVA